MCDIILSLSTSLWSLYLTQSYTQVSFTKEMSGRKRKREDARDDDQLTSASSPCCSPRYYRTSPPPSPPHSPPPYTDEKEQQKDLRKILGDRLEEQLLKLRSYERLLQALACALCNNWISIKGNTKFSLSFREVAALVLDLDPKRDTEDPYGHLKYYYHFGEEGTVTDQISVLFTEIGVEVEPLPKFGKVSKE